MMGTREMVAALLELDCLTGVERLMLLDVQDTILKSQHVGTAREMRVHDLYRKYHE